MSVTDMCPEVNVFARRESKELLQPHGLNITDEEVVPLTLPDCGTRPSAVALKDSRGPCDEGGRE
jgi:hypothetical protein